MAKLVRMVGLCTVEKSLLDYLRRRSLLDRKNLPMILKLDFLVEPLDRRTLSVPPFALPQRLAGVDVIFALGCAAETSGEP